MRGIKQKLNKNIILDYISQADIFAYYISIFSPITSDYIDYLANTGKIIKSPIRLDNSPSFGFKYNNKGKLKARDFGGYFWGDCFDLVGYLLRINVNNKNGFMIVLNKIANDFNLYNIIQNKITTKLIDTSQFKINIKEIQNETKIIEPIIRNFNSNDIQYWTQHRININRLNKEYVYAISKLLINSKQIYTYNPNNPAYAYYNGINKDNIQLWRLYFPYKKYGFPKFITNNNRIQGLLTYNKDADVLIITKSQKDIMAIKCAIDTYFNNYSITVIAPPSENIYFTDEQLQWLINNHKVTFTLFDFDKVGINHTNYIKRKYPINILFFTNGKYNTKNYNVKDFSEYRSKYTNTDFVNLINNIIEEYNIKEIL